MRTLLILLLLPIFSFSQNTYKEYIKTLFVSSDSVFDATHENPVKKDMEIMNEYKKQFDKLKLNKMEGTKLTEQFLLDNGFTNECTLFGKTLKMRMFERNFKTEHPFVGHRLVLWQGVNDNTKFYLYDCILIDTEEQVKGIFKHHSGGEPF